MLVHVVDGTSPDPLGDYAAIRTELELFNAALAEKPQVPAQGAVGALHGQWLWKAPVLHAMLCRYHGLAVRAAMDRLRA